MAAGEPNTEVILFEHKFFRGRHKHVFGPEGESDLNKPEDNVFFKLTSSMVVKGKPWLFYPRQDFEVGGPPPAWDTPIEVGPGVYETTQQANPKLIDNKIQSLQPKP
jgi:hypothetical protein